ncbi:MAG: ribosomal protein L13e [Candidatus Bathyarchaeia archaeon]|jgi:large subunit ribosomal protein L13e
MHHIKPTIQRPNGKTKNGKGFSPDELAKAGVSPFQAKQLGMPVDFRRKSVHESNIEALKAHAAAKTPEA